MIQVSLLSPPNFHHLSLSSNTSCYSHLIIWISFKWNLTEQNVTCLLPFSSYSSAPAACHKNMRGFCESIFTSFYNQRDLGMYLRQQILRWKTCRHALGNVARVVSGNVIPSTGFFLYILFIKAVEGTHTSAAHISTKMLVQAQIERTWRVLEEVDTDLIYYSFSCLWVLPLLCDVR